jgi:hypothetical protein
MARDLLAKADDFEELPGDQPKREKQSRFLLS